MKRRALRHTEFVHTVIIGTLKVKNVKSWQKQNNITHSTEI